MLVVLVTVWTCRVWAPSGLRGQTFDAAHYPISEQGSIKENQFSRGYFIRNHNKKNPQTNLLWKIDLRNRFNLLDVLGRKNWAPLLISLTNLNKTDQRSILKLFTGVFRKINEKLAQSIIAFFSTGETVILLYYCVHKLTIYILIENQDLLSSFTGYWSR